MLHILAAILVSYLIGSIPNSFIIAKLLKRVDIRDYGSGSVGATNLSRIAGKGPALCALILDIAKGGIVVTLVANGFRGYAEIIDFNIFQYILGLAAIVGHTNPVFLKFKGGKGVATGSGVMLVVAPEVFIIGALIWVIVAIISRYISLASITGSISLPITAAIMGKPISLVIFCLTLCIITSYKHKSNITRLIQGIEPKIGSKVKVK